MPITTSMEIFTQRVHENNNNYMEDPIYKKARELIRSLSIDGHFTPAQEKSWKIHLKIICDIRDKGTQAEYHKNLRRYCRELKKSVK